MPTLAYSDNEEIYAHILSNKQWRLQTTLRKALPANDNSTLMTHHQRIRRNATTKNEVKFQQSKSRFNSRRTFRVRLYTLPVDAVETCYNLRPSTSLGASWMYSLDICMSHVLIGRSATSLFSLHSRHIVFVGRVGFINASLLAIVHFAAAKWSKSSSPTSFSIYRWMSAHEVSLCLHMSISCARNRYRCFSIAARSFLGLQMEYFRSRGIGKARERERRRNRERQLDAKATVRYVW